MKNKLRTKEPVSTLPAIKRLKRGSTTARSPDLYYAGQNLLGSLSPIPKDSEIPAKNPEGLIQLAHTYDQKVNNLLKIIEDQSQYIQALEQEFQNQDANTVKTEKTIDIDKIIVGNHEEQKKVDAPNNNFSEDVRKNNEILNLRKQIEEDQAVISQLTMEVATNRKKLPDFNEIIEKSLRIEKEMQEIQISWQQELEKAANSLKEKENELEIKEKELKDIAYLLKRSEEKRSYSNDYNIFMEANNSKLKDKLSILQQEKAKVEKELEEVRRTIIEKELLLENLKQKHSELTANFEIIKSKNTEMSSNYETVKDSLKIVSDKNEMIKMKYKLEKEKNKKSPKYHKTEKSKFVGEPIKRRTIALDQTPLNEIVKEEHSRWHERLSNMVGEMTETKNLLNGLHSTETYLKNLIMAKDMMIEQLKKKIRENGEDEKKIEEKPKKEKNKQIKAKNIAELITLMEELKYRYKSTEDVIKCVACFKVPNESFLASPCGHLSCKDCKEEFLLICPHCSTKVDGMVNAQYFDRVVSNLKNDLENVDKAKKFLEYSNY